MGEETKDDIQEQIEEIVKEIKDDSEKKEKDEKIEELSNENDVPNKKGGGFFWFVFTLIFLLIFFVTVCIIGFTKYSQYKAEKLYAEFLAQQEAAAIAEKDEAPVAEEPVQEQIDVEPEPVVSKVPEKELDWNAIHAENADIYGWIVVDGTVIDYPLLSSPENKDTDYYLDHNLDGSYGPYPGCIYSQSVFNNTDFTDFNLVLYGHNMKNGSMFAGLHKFEDLTFFNENEYIYVYTPDKNYAYRIFAAHKTSDQLIFDKYSFVTEYDRLQYIEEVMGVSDMSAHYRDGVEVTPENKIITLSTCISGQGDKRWVVWGVMEE